MSWPSVCVLETDRHYQCIYFLLNEESVKRGWVKVIYIDRTALSPSSAALQHTYRTCHLCNRRSLCYFASRNTVRVTRKSSKADWLCCFLYKERVCRYILILKCTLLPCLTYNHCDCSHSKSWTKVWTHLDAKWLLRCPRKEALEVKLIRMHQQFCGQDRVRPCWHVTGTPLAI